MSFIHAIILGLVQGLTEFLPVSSSGHLLIFNSLLGYDRLSITFSVIVHFASLIAVVIFFYKDILSITKAVLGFVFNRSKQSKEALLSAKFGFFIILSTIPTAFMGIFLKDFFEQFFAAGWYTGIFLIVTAIFLMIAHKFTSGKKTMKEFKWFDSLLIGIAQGFAIFPGVSRSGSTISMALLRGIKPELAARYSFILSIPAILGAVIFDVKDVAGTFSLVYVAALVASFVSSMFAIGLFIKILEKKRLDIFAIYCVIVGILIMISGI